MKPSIFISYSHADKPVASAIASRLSELGAKVWIDEGELLVGDSIIERIATAIADVHFFVAIVSPNSVNSQWCQKELSLAITGSLSREGVKVLPLRLGDVEMPASLADTLHLPVDPDDPGAMADRLLRDAQTHLSQRPAATGSWTTRKGRARATSAAESMSEAGPITLTGIVEEGIGTPKGDGSAGSALYAVPFRLSRTPTRDWANHLVTTWNRPPAWSSMHRFGAARVSGDVVTLNGVTMQEVEQYHLKTLKLCIDKVNDDIAEDEQRKRTEAERERQRVEQHQASVDEAMRRLKFDDQP